MPVHCDVLSEDAVGAASFQGIRDCPAAVITPISSRARKDYDEQLRLKQQGRAVLWDDSRFNKSRPGDLFIFSFHNQKVVVHSIDAVLPPSQRPPSWAANEGQQQRNVVVLSDVVVSIAWHEWLQLGGPALVRATQTLKTNLRGIERHVRAEMLRFRASACL
jgi:hypothetical protein